MKLLNYRNYGRLWRVYGRSLIRYSTPRKFVNAIRTEYAYRKRKSDVPSKPYLLFIEPLYYCNLSCPLCQRQTWGEARKNDAGRLPLSLFDKILDQIGDYLYQCHIFGLGEPLLDWNLTRQIIEKCHQKKIFTLVSTNCTILNPKMAEEIVASGLDHLVCAIDGVSQASYSAYRVGGDFNQAIANLKLLLDERRRQNSSMQIEWQFLVNAFNHHELADAERLARQLGVYIRFSPIGGIEWDAELQNRWLPNSTDWQDSRLPPGENRNDFPCYWLWRGAVVNSNGQLARCPGYQNVAQMGSLQDHELMSLYNSRDSQRSRQLFSPEDVGPGDFPTPCNTCSFYRRHHGGANLTKADSVAAVPSTQYVQLSLTATRNGGRKDMGANSE